MEATTFAVLRPTPGSCSSSSTVDGTTELNLETSISPNPLRCFALLFGKDIDEIVEAIENLKEKISFYGTLETLENAIKGGRINPLAGKIIGALNFKAIVQIKDGVVKPIDKARGESNSIKKVANYITSNIEDTKDKILCLMHANCPEKAHKLLSIIEKTHKFDEVYISEVGPVMGTYTSEGAVLGAVL